MRLNGLGFLNAIAIRSTTQIRHNSTLSCSRLSGYKDCTANPGDKVYVAMSSGVDSSTVAAMVKETGANVRGIFMANWSSTSKCMESDWNDVQKVCQSIGIECERVNFERDYWLEVFEPMIEMYKNGYTPNPDVGCNRHIKFGALMNYLKNRDDGEWWLATGHYARVARPEEGSGDECHLMKPKYLQKDQSYYLSSIQPSVLNRVLFPLASYTKPEIREMASKYGLHTATKKDSQGLCFVSQNHNNFKDFLNEYVENKPGDVVTENGLVVGKHNGIWGATIGQRSSLSMPQGDPNFKGQWFVSAKNIEKNQLVIVRGRDNPSLYFSNVDCENFHWLGDYSKIDPTELSIQYRSLQDPEPVKELNVSGSTVNVKFQNPRRAVAPGQYLVIYHKDRVLGSGIIKLAS